VQQILALPRRPDALVATGDLTDHGAPDEYAHLAELLAPLQMPVYLLAGNHDDRNALQAAFPDQTHLRGEDGFVQYVVEDWPLRIVVLDTVVPGADGGALCARRLDWLDRTLAQFDRPTLVAQHHPPFATGLAAMDEQLLAEPQAEAVVIRRHPQVERIVCGHIHRTIQARFAGTVASVCASTAQQLVLDLAPGAALRLTYEPPSFQLHLWTGRELVSHTAVVGDYPVWTSRD
jgi:3',5'-cyclic AMP phosphodiesterase CpdA